ncbi:hypothetical protein COU74_03250 [Candidatus Peregrinibacteria bacterium CG10_big_fil_rev_8_21_14_0_10_36_19]|nr:MAG: hypothetical protein COU74_03250 [Candidatus Peregrinibacteria bacterium CG10_big_fil_rev_8_21_14_0_10_36_19]
MKKIFNILLITAVLLSIGFLAFGNGSFLQGRVARNLNLNPRSEVNIPREKVDTAPKAYNVFDFLKRDETSSRRLPFADEAKPGEAAPPVPCYNNPYPVKPRNYSSTAEVDPCEKVSKLTESNVGEKGGYYIVVVGDKSSFGVVNVLALDDIKITKIVFKWSNLFNGLKGNKGNFKNFDLILYKNKIDKKLASVKFSGDFVVFDNLSVSLKKGEDVDFNLMAEYNSVIDGAKYGTLDRFFLDQITSVNTSGKIYAENGSSDYPLASSNLFKKSYFATGGSIPEKTLVDGKNVLFPVPVSVDKAGDIGLRKISFSLQSKDAGVLKKLDLRNVTLHDQNGQIIKMLSPVDATTVVDFCSDGGKNSNFEDGEYMKSGKIVCAFAEPLILPKGLTGTLELRADVLNSEADDFIITTINYQDWSLVSDFIFANVVKSLSDGEILELNTKIDASGKSLKTPLIWSDLSNNGIGDWSGPEYLPMNGSSQVLIAK